MHKYSRNLYCFSPPIMIATFAIEIGLAIYVIWKFRSVAISRIIVVILLCLGTFQLAEWMVCQGALGVSRMDWSRLGFVAISFLPPLGIHLATSLAGRSAKHLVYAGYAAATAFSAYFMFATQGITGSVCGGNYVIFQVAPHAITAFSRYYYIMLLLGIGLSLYWSTKAPDKASKSALRGLAAGYSAFMIPTLAVYGLNPETAAGIPSIMCGFAVLLALSLVLWVLPKHLESSVYENNTTPTDPMRSLRTS